MSRNLFVHGHFYQPPEFNPFSGNMPEYDACGARNFTEKVTQECYSPNADNGNLSLMSFDFGANLLKFLQQYRPETYSKIINADRDNVRAYGAGNAIAMPYNHTILPLSRTREGAELQIKWGILDFEARFGRKPKGMWLPECAVNKETLALLVKNGLEFTILGYNQIRSGNTSGIYRTETKEGILTLFLFDNGISNTLSFCEEATRNADNFMDSIKSGSKKSLMVATDGELYGHHHKFQDMFLNYLLTHSAKNSGFEVAFPEMLLKDKYCYGFTEIIENSSWSCAHNLNRWKRGCSCTEGDFSWKRGLRNAMHSLDEGVTMLLEADGISENSMALEMFILTKIVPDSLSSFTEKHLGSKTSAQRERILKLLDAKYYAQLSMTSCGYFFNDLDEIRPTNNIRYAADAISLVKSACETADMQDLEKKVCENLHESRSARTGRTALDIYGQIKREAKLN